MLLVVKKLEHLNTNIMKMINNYYEVINNVPVSEFNNSLVSTSYKFAVLSHDAVIICSPPSNQSLAITGPLCPENVHEGVRNTGTTRSSSASVSSDSRSL